MCICTIRIAYMYVYSSILFRCIYLFMAAFSPVLKPSIVPVISLECVYSPTHHFLKIGYYVALEDFLHFSKKCTVIILYVNSHQELKLLKAFV